jgi:hypothetical protein
LRENDRELIQLDAKKEKAIIALLKEPTITLAAKLAGVSESTLYRWLQDDNFNHKYFLSRRKVLEQTITMLQVDAYKAVETLKEIISDETSPTSSKVSACKLILDMAFKSFELEDLLKRLEEIEKNLSNKQNRI